MSAPLISHSCGLKRVVAAVVDGQLDLFDGAVGRAFVRALELDTGGHHQAARDLYWECVEAENRIADAFCNLATLSYEGGDEALAREYLADALINDPTHGVAHYNTGTLALFKGDNRLAILHYREALAEPPTFSVNLPCVALNLAVALAQDGQYGESLDTLERISGWSSAHGEEARQILEIVKGMQASQLPLQEEVERLIAALEQAKQRAGAESGEMRSKEFRSIATAIQALQKLVS